MNQREMMMIVALGFLIVGTTAVSSEDICDILIDSYAYFCPGHGGAECCVQATQRKNELEAANDLAEGMKKIILELATKLQELRSNPSECEPTTKTRTCADSSFSYGAKCFTILDLKSSYHMTYSQAVALCADDGSQVAEVHDKIQQIALLNYLRSQLPPGTTMAAFWVGPEYISSRSTLLYRSGKETHSSQFMWYSTFYPSGSNKLLSLDVRLDESGNEGLWNTGQTTKLNAVLCERDI